MDAKGEILLLDNWKAKSMQVPSETKPALWGAAGGAIALAIVGFTWGGWMTTSTANKLAEHRADSAVVAILTPICVDKFQHATDATAQLVELKKVDPWSQGEFVEKGGWATVPGTNSPEQVTGVAKACASMLANA